MADNLPMYHHHNKLHMYRRLHEVQGLHLQLMIEGCVHHNGYCASNPWRMPDHSELQIPRVSSKGLDTVWNKITDVTLSIH